MNNYIQPTREQFEAALGDGWQLLDLPGTRELVYGKRVDRGGQALSVRVYTSLEPDGLGRECGKDAIRVEVWLRRPATFEKRLVRLGGSKRVNRVPGWQERLKERIAKWDTHLGPQCPSCGLPCVERKRKQPNSNPFWGCSGFPVCRFTAAKKD